MRRIGLTGGIASGKSTVSKYLRKTYGAEILDADAAAHVLAEPGYPIWDAFVSRYGRERVVRPDGNLDRGRIAEIVFHDARERQWMNETTHPMIRREILTRLAACEQSGRPVAVLDVPLLYEAGWDSFTDEVWVVYVDAETQLNRLMARDGISETLARERIASQMSLEEKKKRADVVIDNRGTKRETIAQVRAAFHAGGRKDA